MWDDAKLEIINIEDGDNKSLVATNYLFTLSFTGIVTYIQV